MYHVYEKKDMSENLKDRDHLESLGVNKEL
jgi:hypothetical protein